MTITVKKEVEETLVIPVPFASKDDCFHFIVTEKYVLLFREGHLSKRESSSEFFSSNVKEALKGTPITVEEAEKKLEEVIQSFQPVAA